MTRGYCLLLLALASTAWANTPLTRTTEKLLEKLRKAPEGYDPAVRPTRRDGDTTMVQVQTFFRDIEIDDVTMEANFDITFRMIWKDHRLTYVPDSRDVTYVTVLDADLVWLPDAFFKNALVTQRSTIHPETFMRIYPSGRIVYSTRVSLRQSCPMNLARFPHDLQTCTVMIASYGYTMDNIKFEFAGSDSISIAADIHAARFTLDKFSSGSCNSNTSTGSYSCVQVAMSIRRVFGSYLIDWYFPTMFLVVVAWFSFLVPAEMFLGRLLLTLIPLITLASFCNSYKESLASVAYIRALDIFTGISLTVVFFTLVYVIVCQVKGSKKKTGGDDEAGNVEDGEVKSSPSGGEATGVRGLMRRVQQRGQYFSRLAIISVYVLFLFLYFVAYCGTG